MFSQSLACWRLLAPVSFLPPWVQVLPRPAQSSGSGLTFWRNDNKTSRASLANGQVAFIRNFCNIWQVAAGHFPPSMHLSVLAADQRRAAPAAWGPAPRPSGLAANETCAGSQDVKGLFPVISVSFGWGTEEVFDGGRRRNLFHSEGKYLNRDS